MALKRGKQTYLFQHPAAIQSFAAIGSKREGEGPLGEFFDTIDPDSTFGQKSWERAESRLHHDTVELAVKKAGLSYADLDCLLAGDLLNQCIGATFGVRELGIPYLGIYGACSNMAEGLLLSAFLAESGLRYLGVSTASHFCTAERQYRFPLEYGGIQRTPTSQWTVTGGGAVVVAGAAAQTLDRPGRGFRRQPSAPLRTRASRTPPTWALPWLRQLRQPFWASCPTPAPLPRTMT